MSLEEEEEQTLVVNDCSRPVKIGFSDEWTLSCRVSILGIMRVLCGDYQQMKVMSICLWWIDRVHLELWQIWMGLNGDNLESHIHHWIVCCCWRTSWFQLIFIDTRYQEERWWHESFIVIELIVSMRWTQNRDCHCHWWWCLSNCVCKWQICSSWLYFTFSFLEGMTLMSLWLNWLINMVTQ